jgi:hypothetical protein
MIYLHCKFYNVIKINYGGPDTGHVRPAVAGRSLETPGLDNRLTEGGKVVSPMYQPHFLFYNYKNTQFKRTSAGMKYL